MAKRKQKQRKTAPVDSASGDNNGNTNDVGGDGEQEVGWASIPGKRLDVDIANSAADGGPIPTPVDTRSTTHHPRSKKRPHSSTQKTTTTLQEQAEEASEEDDEFNIRKWTSRHYDQENDDEEFDDDDLFDPDPRNKTNKFDAGSKMDGANDDGMFLSLEVIPGDAYKVQTLGDDASGFVTKVVFTNKDDSREGDIKKADTTKNESNNSKKEKDSKKSDDESAKVKADGDGGPQDGLTRRERQKLKRKLQREKVKERKRLKREEVDKSSSSGDAPSSKSAREEGKTSKKGKLQSAQEDTTTSAQQQAATEEAIVQLQTSWSISAPGVSLHATLCAGLHSLNYTHPTPIQSATLPAAILGRRDIVGAAPTGSGKTLSYGLPILQNLLDGMDERMAAEEAGGDDDGPRDDGDETRGTSTTSAPSQPQHSKLPLQALILTPTRELAIQVASELQKICRDKIKIGTIVGGFAEVKQRRTLEKTRPPVLVATPGRLWELMSSKEYTHLNNLTQLRFLVIDEADRMIQQGNFPQLQQIFEVINLANPAPEDSDSEDEDSSGDEEEDGRLKSLVGVRGEAKVVMLSDSILDAIERQRNGGAARGGDTDVPKPMEIDDDEFEEQQQQLLDDESDTDSVEEEAEPVHRQTFVYSATLTLPPSMHHLIKKDVTKKKFKSKRKGSRQPTTVDGAIANMLDVAGARGETKIVNLSNTMHDAKKKKKKDKDSEQDKKGNSKKDADESSSATAVAATRLPAGLTLGEIPCAQRHKDSHLYAYLVTTRQGSSGPCLVFCNSIAAVRRVGETLQTLGLPVKMLHAQMQQKSRLGALESLRTSNSRSVVVASDVAARGLDIPSVTTVIHYDVARVVDTFIHRAGRTARGVGEKAVGTSISLVAPAEEREHQKICEAVKGSGSKSLGQVHIDGRLLNEAQERVALATKIVSCNDVESQASRSNKWLQDAAKDAGLEVDEDMMEGGLLAGDRRDRQRFLEAKRAKGELRQLLAKPMRKQNFGKFLSGAGLRDSIKAEGEVKPFVVKQASSRGKNRRKKGLKNK